METHQAGVDAPALTAPTVVNLGQAEGEIDETTLDEGIRKWIESKYMPKEEVEKHVGKVKSAEQRRVEEEKQARLGLEKKLSEVITYNQQWQAWYDEQNKSKLKDADPEERARFYEVEMKKREDALQKMFGYIQQMDETQKSQSTAEKMWRLACEEASKITGHTVNPSDPNALKVREEFERTPYLPFRLMEFASTKQREEATTTAEVNKVPSTPPSSRHRSPLADFIEGKLDAAKEEEIISLARAGRLK